MKIAEKMNQEEIETCEVYITRLEGNGGQIVKYLAMKPLWSNVAVSNSGR